MRAAGIADRCTRCIDACVNYDHARTTIEGAIHGSLQQRRVRTGENVALRIGQDSMSCQC
jgi:hypothetical protein